MPRKVGTVIRVGADGYRAARELYKLVKAHGWSVVQVRDEYAPKKITLGSVVTAILQRAVRASV